jgi:energy-converting hydrogenase Eha subunit A
MQQNPPSERQCALFALGAEAIRLVRDGAIRPADLAAITALLTALMDADRREASDAA